MEDKLQNLQRIIGYHFFNEGLLKCALTHSSYANERKINKVEDYERLEFLGDAVLEMVSSEFLYLSHPEMREGQLTRLRASMVCEPALAFCAKDISLGEYIYLGKGEEATGGRNRSSVTSDVLEAIIGAIFLDGGIENAKIFIQKFILNDLENKTLFYDSKTLLQEEIQKKSGRILEYRLLREEGPEHDKNFVVEVLVDGKVRAVGEGHNKKLAEQDAAYKVLIEIRKGKEN